MNNIQIIKQTELCGHQFAVYGTPQEPLFKAQDLASILSLTNVSDMISRVDVDEVAKLNLGSLQGETWFLTEDGLYEVLMQSRKPIAKKFKKGVKTILKEVRQNGGYISTSSEDSPELIMARALQVAQITIDRHQQQLLLAKNTIEQQQERIAKDAPKVLFADAVCTSSRSCLIAELAKIITQNGFEIGQNRLFKWLREKGYLGTTGEYYNMPTQRYIEQGLFEIKKTTINKPDGTVLVSNTPKVTGKGQIYFVNKFLKGDVAA